MSDSLYYASAHQFDFWQDNAVPDKLNGHMAAVFADSGDDFLTFDFKLPRIYDLGAIRFEIYFASTTVNTGGAKWDLEIEKLAADGNSIMADNYGIVTSITKAVGTTTGSLAYAIKSVLSGSMASPAVGDYMRCKLTRDTTDAADTLVGDANVLGVGLDGGFA